LSKFILSGKNNNLNESNLNKVTKLINATVLPSKILSKEHKGDFLRFSKTIFFHHAQLKKSFEITQNGLLVRLQHLMNNNLPYDFFLNFLHNLFLNPDEDCIKQLYRFLDSNDLPITPDGYFLGYKYVRADYKDVHSGSFDNSVGSKPTMKRFEVTKDPHEACSSGLHICSYNYLSVSVNWDNSRVMLAKVNPKDVVSIPFDYKNSKLRCCTYEIIGEFPSSKKLEDCMSKYADSGTGKDLMVIYNDLANSYIDYFGIPSYLFATSRKDEKEEGKLDIITSYLNLYCTDVDIDMLLARILLKFPFLQNTLKLKDALQAYVYQPDKLFSLIVKAKKE
jgi:hypothetical protein